MSKRTDALWRIAAFFWSMAAGILASFVIFGAMIWGAVDIVWQLLAGTDGLSSSGSIATFVKDVLYWPIDLQVYAFTGDGEFAWTWMS